ncbi:hypothetical protein EV193_101323 [Herbihabitans rhizosphaerae]|uniref:PAP2 superfamily protein n=1 Tax=Herbihabitans rhizosphaerae TaxID=1872711 RepID=A0A4Q7L575_9PSEU|nr:vanadium-dependent haloperoxidase [Herbihabitans rhizosphaerae]RZS44447.1 hypothetical protein EV193_101323 [Herbihabitans rhizosphaerae]
MEFATAERGVIDAPILGEHANGDAPRNRPRHGVGDDGVARWWPAAPARWIGPTQPAPDPAQRVRHGRAVRSQAAELGYPTYLPEHPDNGEESDYPFLAVYSKGLPHNELGEVEPAAYRMLRHALRTGHPADFDRIPQGIGNARKQLGPQGGLALDLLGPDPQALVVPPAPRVDSGLVAAEMAELYWMALLRDVPFTEFEESPLAAVAAADLTRYAAYRGPRENGIVTPRTLFRGDTRGDRTGPFISQFLLQTVPYGTYRIPQLSDTVQPGVDYATEFGEWLAVQRGMVAQTPRDFVNTRYIQTPRDMGHYTHFDVLYQPYLYACLVLLGMPGYPAALQDHGNPYLHSPNQVGFPTFGTPHLVTMLAEVANRAIKHTEYQQFFVHRRLRPEALGGRIEVHLAHDRGRYDGILHPAMLDSEVLDRVRGTFGSCLLPQGFPEGSPMSPSYQSGHSTVAGACVTVLKAWFNEAAPLPDPVVPSPDGKTLVPYQGFGSDGLTVGGELNKLASNVGAGRAMPGVHYRSDNTEAFRLGEEIAIRMLREKKSTYRESCAFSLTRFDGTAITV